MAELRRLLIAPTRLPTSGSMLVLEADERHYLRRVLLRPGDHLLLLMVRGSWSPNSWKAVNGCSSSNHWINPGKPLRLLGPALVWQWWVYVAVWTTRCGWRVSWGLIASSRSLPNGAHPRQRIAPIAAHDLEGSGGAV